MKVNYKGQKVEMNLETLISEKDGVKTYLGLVHLPTTIGGTVSKAVYADIDEKGKVTTREAFKRDFRKSNTVFKKDEQMER